MEAQSLRSLGAFVSTLLFVLSPLLPLQSKVEEPTEGTNAKAEVTQEELQSLPVKAYLTKTLVPLLSQVIFPLD